jgi:hypothetical protein
VWIVGTYLHEVNPNDFANETYSLHWNGSSWKIVPMPLEPGTNPNFEYALGAVKANSPTDVWAVGTPASTRHSTRWSCRTASQAEQPQRAVAPPGPKDCGCGVLLLPP